MLYALSKSLFVSDCYGFLTALTPIAGSIFAPRKHMIRKTIFRSLQYSIGRGPGDDHPGLFNFDIGR